MRALSPPSRRRAGVSQYGLCVYAGCGNRADRLARILVGGRDREVPVCARHAGSTPEE
jgi:hypothetical protein